MRRGQRWEILGPPPGRVTSGSSLLCQGLGDGEEAGEDGEAEEDNWRGAGTEDSSLALEEEDKGGAIKRMVSG